jgi:YHS domain-containing protein
MRRTLAFALIFAAAGCGGSSKPSTAAQAAKHNDMKTIDTADVRPTVMDPPPVLTEEAPPPKALRASLPFAPAIGMDPVDGSKISIRATTPMTEYKNKIFYFSSEENKRTFASNPEQYSKGPFSHL